MLLDGLATLLPPGLETRNELAMISLRLNVFPCNRSGSAGQRELLDVQHEVLLPLLLDRRWLDPVKAPEQLEGKGLVVPDYLSRYANATAEEWTAELATWFAHQWRGAWNENHPVFMRAAREEWTTEFLLNLQRADPVLEALQHFVESFFTTYCPN